MKREAGDYMEDIISAMHKENTLTKVKRGNKICPVA